MTTGSPLALPLASSAARGDLVHDADLGGGQFPAGGVGGAPEVDDGGDAGAPDGDVGQAVAPRSPEGVRDDDGRLPGRSGPGGRRGCGGRCGRGRRAAGRRSPWPTLERSTPALAHTKPCLVSEMMSPSRSRRTLTLSDRTRRRRASGSAGSTGTRRPSALETIFCVITRHVVVLQAGAWQDQVGDLVAGPDLG